MTPFEFIIICLIETFCMAFFVQISSEIKCNMFVRVLLFLLAPLITITLIGAFVADIINKSFK